MNQSVLTFLDHLSDQRVLIVGDVMLDEYIWGEVVRISPEAPVPIVNIQRRSYRPGGASNVAASVVALGSLAFLGGVVGDDPMAHHLRAVLHGGQIRIDAGLIVVAGRPTTVKTRIIAHNQQMLRCDSEVTTPLDRATEATLLAWVADHLATATVCVLSDYAKGVLSRNVCQSIIALAQQRQIPIVVDPKGHDFSRYAGATVITPNVHEAALATRLPITTRAELDAAADLLLAQLPHTALIITRGADGMALYRTGTEPVLVPAQARAVYDVTGAGDTVVATLALMLGAGAPLGATMHLATAAAGVVIGKIGTATISRDELREAWTMTHFDDSIPGE